MAAVSNHLSPFPVPQTALLPYSLSHKHPSPLPSWSRFETCSPVSSLCCKHGLSPFWLAANWAKQTGRVADRVLVLRPGVRLEPLRWEIQVQDSGPPETSRPHVVSIGESSTRDLRLSAKIQLHSMTSEFHCWTPHAKQLARQEHNPTH